jgi:hypothetical protein
VGGVGFDAGGHLDLVGRLRRTAAGPDRNLFTTEVAQSHARYVKAFTTLGASRCRCIKAIMASGASRRLCAAASVRPATSRWICA